MMKKILHGVLVMSLFLVGNFAFAAGSEDVIFLHHSTGGNLYSQGNVAGYFANYNATHGTNYVINERAYPTSPYPWNNYPYDWWNLWSTEDGNGNPRTPSCDSNDPDIECLDSLVQNHDVIIFKQCYPGADVLADTGTPDVSSSRKSLENYKEQYRALRREFDKYPDTMFIAWTLVPRHRLATNSDNAARAKEFVDWVKTDWLTEDGQVHPNIKIFDFWGYAAESNPPSTNGVVNTLKYDYERSHTGSDSHPNLLANQTIGPIFAQEIINNIESFFQVQWWKPTATQNLTWQWQLNTGDIDTSYDVDMYDVDLFDTPQNKIDELHASGKKVVCYFSAGSWEDWRDDAGDFSESVKGNDLDGWPGEKWLDIRDMSLRPIMQARLDKAVAKHCDGVEPDNVDGYTNNTGFSLTASDQLTYNRWLATEAHNRGLSIGLKNDIEQISVLVNDFDWALNEQCYQYNECDGYQIFINANKPVFGVEYNLEPSEFCPQANVSKYSWLKKNLNLDAWRFGCENYANSNLYRFWSKKNKSHFYTANEKEKNYIIAHYDDYVWKYEGVANDVFTTQVPNSTPVYRFWSKKNKGHFYTASEEEKNYVINHYDDYIWKYEGIAYYAYPTQQPNTKPIYRFWSKKNKHHFYTASEEEKNLVISKYDDYVWKYEGMAWYVLSN